MDEINLGPDSTLTEWEWLGLHRDFNLADGHAHHSLGPEERGHAIGCVSSLVAAEAEDLQSDLEDRFLTSFFRLSNQKRPDLPPFFHYSSSVSIDLTAKLLWALGVRRIGLLTPTFDNIPLLLRRAGFDVVPLEEEKIWSDSGYRASQARSLEALFLVCPNNPTGHIVGREIMLEILTFAAQSKIILVIDFSFRFYSDLHVWDQYAALSEVEGLRYILLEDSGKTWPISELKVGIACPSPNLHQAMAEIGNELLLNVSPFVLRLLTGLLDVELASAAEHNGKRLRVLSVVAENRALLRRALAGTDLEVVAPNSTISVEWLRLPKPVAVELARSLASGGVSVLPGGPFYWDDRRRGDSYIRVALARSPVYFRAAVSKLIPLALSSLNDL